MKEPIIEACVDSYESCSAAFGAGADRFELCANLVIGGTTPSPAFFRQIKKDFDIKINVLIRPRFGDFLYSDTEISQMCEEIAEFSSLGANGVVIGALTEDGELDMYKMKRMISAAENMDVTLHRAFDVAQDPYKTLEQAVELGCKTILTSGQAKNAPAGAEILRRLNAQSAERIDIMAGSGVNSGNIREIYSKTAITTFHTSGRTRNIESKMRYRKEGVSMGLDTLSEYTVFRTDSDEFRRCAQTVHSLK